VGNGATDKHRLQPCHARGRLVRRAYLRPGDVGRAGTERLVRHPDEGDDEVGGDLGRRASGRWASVDPRAAGNCRWSACVGSGCGRVGCRSRWRSHDVHGVVGGHSVHRCCDWFGAGAVRNAARSPSRASSKSVAVLQVSRHVGEDSMRRPKTRREMNALRLDGRERSNAHHRTSSIPTSDRRSERANRIGRRWSELWAIVGGPSAEIEAA